jgi:hypothetical protein
MLSGCKDLEDHEEWVRSKATDLRMTFEFEGQKVTPAGDPIAGAIVGHVIAGKKGALVGALAESYPSETIPGHGKLVACQFKANLPDGSYLVFVARYDDMKDCSLLREGDEINILNRDGVFHWRSYTSGELFK